MEGERHRRVLDGETLIYQGTVLVDMDPAAMVAALRVPRAKLEKPSRPGASVSSRCGNSSAEDAGPARDQRALLEAFAERFDVEWSDEDLGAEEESLAWRRHAEGRAPRRRAEIDDPARDGDFAAGQHVCPGGSITSYLRLEGPVCREWGSC